MVKLFFFILLQVIKTIPKQIEPNIIPHSLPIIKNNKIFSLIKKLNNYFLFLFKNLIFFINILNKKTNNFF